MTIIASIDGNARRVYLHADTVGATIHPVDIYKEMRSLRRTDESLRKYNLFIKVEGNVSKGGGKFTERYAVLLEGTRIVPYDTSHVLTVNGTVITDDGQEGIAAFDKAPLSPTTSVDIAYIPPQVEIIEVNTTTNVVTGDLATVEAKIDLIPINPLLDDDIRIDGIGTSSGGWDDIIPITPVTGSYGEWITDKLLTEFGFNAYK